MAEAKDKATSPGTPKPAVNLNLSPDATLSFEGNWFDINLVNQAAEEILKAAELNCPDIESRLKYLADKWKGQMIGLEFKIKPLGSLIRKMTAMWKMPSQTIQDIKNAQYDALRFTMLLPTETYTEGVKAVMEELKTQEGCTEYDTKNYWNCQTYRGINSIFTTRLGLKFELQFHTEHSFDQKQNKTHLLYEALRVEKNPLKQNIFHLDMARMWDDLETPPNVESIGHEKKQDLPQPKDLSEAEKKVIDTIVQVKQMVHDELNPLQSSLKAVEPRLTPLIEYCCMSFNASMRKRDQKFRGSLQNQRKVEEDLRHYFGANPAQMLYDLNLPPLQKMGGVIKELCVLQPDFLTYTLVMAPEQYTAATIGILDLLRGAGVEILFVDNHWHDYEKHHPIAAGCRLAHDHPVRRGKREFPLTFTVEFHTPETYDGNIIRKTVKAQIEESLYRKGMCFKKDFIDQNLRFDPALCEMWLKVVTPAGAEEIGRRHEIGTSATCEATSHTQRWLTPGERSLMRIHAEWATAILTAGAVFGFVLAKLLYNK